MVAGHKKKDKRYCIGCNEIIFNRTGNALYCIECAKFRAKNLREKSRTRHINKLCNI
jgi:hypothetical protein